MGNEPNEDAIEAMIRRVAEAKAARAAEIDAPEDSAREELAERIESNDAQRGRLVDAMMRGVAQARSAREVEPRETPLPASNPTMDEQQRRIELMVQRVAEAKAARIAEESGAGARPAIEDDDAGTREDEDFIEATIRRVRAEKDAQAAREDADGAAAEGGVAYDEPARTPDNVGGRDESAEVGGAVGAVAEGQAAVEPAGRAYHDDDRSAVEDSADAAGPFRDESPIEQPENARQVGVPAPRGPDIAAQRSWDELGEVVLQLQREFGSMSVTLAALSARLEALERVVGGAEPPPPAAASEDDEGEWDETPALPRIPLGQAPRPAIFRTVERAAPAVLAEAIVDEDNDEDEEGESTAPAAPQPTRARIEAMPSAANAPRRGLDLLPRTYRITVEDKRRGVDLVPLHRALLGLSVVRDMSLLSYSNGVAIVSLDTLDALDSEDLRRAIGRAMSRDAAVEVHNEQTMVVKLAEE